MIIKVKVFLFSHYFMIKLGQKINAYSYRIGLFLNWKIFFQYFNRLPNYYPIQLFNKKDLEIYIRKFINGKNYFDKVFCTFSHIQFFSKPLKYDSIKIFYANYKTQSLLKNNTGETKSLSSLLTTGFYRNLSFLNLNPVFLSLYKFHWFINAVTILVWLKTNLKIRLKKKGVSIRSVLSSMFRHLNDLIKHHTHSIITSNSYGNFKCKITGLKIQCKGWLQRSKRRRSTTVKYRLGNLPLNTLHNVIHYSQDIIVIPSGVIGIKVWLNLKMYSS